MWMKIQRVKTVIYSVSLLVAASSLVPIANAAEKLQTTLRVGTYFRAGHVPDGMVLAQGWVTYHGSHSGFLSVWSLMAIRKCLRTPGRWILRPVHWRRRIRSRLFHSYFLYQ